MFILFDTNVWISQVGLRSKNGAAVRFFARQHNATIAIPEIVQMEVEEILTKRMLELRMKIADSHRQLLPLFGQLQQLDLPSDEDIRNAVANIIPDFDVPTRHIPLNLDATRSSILKLVKEIPPSKRKEQFRDGLIWAHCIELLSEGDVYFVSEDPDFYDNEKNGLASELILEMQNQSQDNRVFLKHNISDLLDAIRVPVELNKHQIVDIVSDSHSDVLDELLNSHGFQVCDGIEGELSCFATEKARMVYFTFDLERPCQDSTSAGRKDGVMRIKGVGFIDPQTKKTTDVQLSNIRLDYPEWQPDGRARGFVFVSAHFNAPALHSIRFPLDSA